MAIKVANNNSLSAITSLPAAVSGGAMTLLETQTASSSSTISFTSNIDSTYKEYVFKFYDIHAATSSAHFTFNFSVDSGSNYNVTKTTSLFYAEQQEDGTNEALSYNATHDLAQSTDFKKIALALRTDNDGSAVGYLNLFDPSSTTFVKHFVAKTHTMQTGTPAWASTYYAAGYGNTTSAVDAIQFKMSSGNIDAGTIKMYGIK